MPSLGQTTTPISSGWGFADYSASRAQLAMSYTAPVALRIDQIAFYASGGGGGSHTFGWGVVWDNSGNVLCKTGQFDMGNSGTDVGGGQGWAGPAGVDTNVIINAGDSIWIGFQVVSGQRHITSYNGGDQSHPWFFRSSAATSAPDSFAGMANASLGLGAAYINYTQVGGYDSDGGTYQPSTFWVSDSAAYQLSQILISDGSAYQNGL